MSITYVQGDATSPVGEGCKIIAHVCNDVGRWGKGFVMAISHKWSQPRWVYLSKQRLILGSVQFVEVVSGEVVVANMIAQRGLRPFGDIPPIRYEALESALLSVDIKASRIGATVHMPRIGCGLAGGDWGKVEKLIQENVLVDVVVYDLP